MISLAPSPPPLPLLSSRHCYTRMSCSIKGSLRAHVLFKTGSPADSNRSLDDKLVSDVLPEVERLRHRRSGTGLSASGFPEREYRDVKRVITCIKFGYKPESARLLFIRPSLPLWPKADRYALYRYRYIAKPTRACAERATSRAKFQSGKKTLCPPHC